MAKPDTQGLNNARNLDVRRKDEALIFVVCMNFSSTRVQGQDSYVVFLMSCKDLGVFIWMPAEAESKEHGKISSYQVFLPYFWILRFWMM